MSDERQLLKRLLRAGAVVEQGGQHLKIKTPDGRLVGILPVKLKAGGGSMRAIKNVVAQCRRAGFVL